MKYFLSCDWGTSSLRLRLADTQTGAVVENVHSDEGIATTYKNWKESGENDRAGFYSKVIGRHIQKLQKNASVDLTGLLLIISGMASSSIGMAELPYAEIPFGLDGSGLNARLFSAHEQFANQVMIISGAKADNDVMRGEETQLIGCIEPDRTIENGLFIMPGTHSKHISVKNNQVIGIRTYMTGEIFGLLAKSSILHASVEPGDLDTAAFGKGVVDSQSQNILHTAFKVRMNDLFNVYGKTSNYSYLSGLLVGAELNDLHLSAAENSTLLCSGEQEAGYRMAFALLFPDRQLNIISGQQAEETVVKGQLKLAKHLNLLP